jgi:hypothetical protein
MVRALGRVRAAISTIAVVLIGFHCACPSPVLAKPSTDGGRDPEPGAKAREPALVKKVVAARWRLADARAVLPPVQLIQKEALEIQDFIQYAFDGGALRLCVSPGTKGDDIFALLADTRMARYSSFAQLVSTEHYTVYHHGTYVVAVPIRPVSGKLFKKLSSMKWTVNQLRQQLGAPSYHWHVHGVGYLGLTYVPQGLSFIGNPRPGAEVLYQVHAQNVEEDWEKEHEVDLPPLAQLSELNVTELSHEGREEFANELLSQRRQIDDAIANGKRSPDGRLVVGHVNLGGLANTEQVVIQEDGKPERRYPAPYFLGDTSILWLNARTLLLWISVADEAFYAMDASTGEMELVAKVPFEIPYNRQHRVTQFGVSGPQRFWYKTQDGETHEVTIKIPRPR